MNLRDYRLSQYPDGVVSAGHTTYVVLIRLPVNVIMSRHGASVVTACCCTKLPHTGAWVLLGSWRLCVCNLVSLH